MKARIKRTYVVYSITNTVTDKRYIGITSDPIRRKRNHLTQLRGMRHINKKLQNAFIKHGENVFVWELLETGLTPNRAKTQEIRWIALFDSFANGYNMTVGGDERGDLGIKCVWDGIEYDSYMDASRTLGLSASTIARRIAAGYTCDEDIPLKHSRRNIIVGGVKYKNKAAAAKSLNMSWSRVKYRIEQGKDSEQVSYPANEKPVTWNGKSYDSLASAARDIGISPNTMTARIANGYTCDADMIRPTIEKACVWNGVQYDSYAACGRALGITASTVEHRISKGWTCDEDIPRVKYAKPFVWQGILYDSIASAARAVGVNVSTFRSRLVKDKSA